GFNGSAASSSVGNTTPTTSSASYSSLASLSSSGDFEIGSSHYLKYGSEFDQVVSQRLLGDEGMELLGDHGSPVIFKLAVPGAVAFHAANAYSAGLPIGLPNLVREVLDAWAFWLANPTFSTQTLEVDCGLKFSTDVPPEWIIDCEQVADPGPRHIPYE